MPFDFEIDLDNMYPETWFGDTPGKRVCLRLCPADKIEEFRKECLKKSRKAILNTATRKMELVDDNDFDSDRFLEMVNAYCIADWDLKDVKGNVIPCTDENKLLLMDLPKFSRFIKECLEELTGLRKKEQEDELKNSQSSQGES